MEQIEEFEVKAQVRDSSKLQQNNNVNSGNNSTQADEGQDMPNCVVSLKQSVVISPKSKNYLSPISNDRGKANTLKP